MGWQDAPVVDSEQPAWAKAPVVGAPPPAPTTKPGEIPGTQFTATPRETPGLMDRLRRLNLKAVGEAVIDQALGAVGGSVGGLGGLVGGVAGALSQAADRRAQPEGGVERSVMEGAQRGAEAMKQSFYGLPLVGQPSRQGQEYSEAAGQAISEIAPAMVAGPGGVVGLARQAPRGAVGTGLRAATDVAESGKAAASDAAMGAVTPRLEPRTMKRLETAYKADIPVNVHQVSGNKFVKLLGEFAEQVPNAGGEKLKQTRKEKLSGALASMIDENANAKVLDDATFKTLQDTAGEGIGEIMARTDVPVDAFGDLPSVLRHETPDVQQAVGSRIADLQKVAEENGGIVPGSTLRKLRTEAQTQQRQTNNGDLRGALERFVKALDDATNSAAAEADVEPLFQLRKSYAISKAIEPLVAKHPDGNFPASSLYSIVTNTAKKKTRMARGEAGEFGDYAELGREVLKETVTSNTAERQLLYSVLKGETAEKPGALLGATMWAGAGLYNLLGPRLLKRVYESQQRRNAPKPEGPPPEPTLGAGFEDVPQGQPPARPSPLGDLTPDWETAPGANGRPRPGEEPGLTPALGESTPAEERGVRIVSPIETPELVGPPRGGRALPETVPPRATETEIPAVPGRPDLPDTMVAGSDAQVAGAARGGETGLQTDEFAPAAPMADVNATGEAMQAPEAALARQKQAEAVLQRAQTVQSPEVKKVLETHAAKLALEAKRIKDAADLRQEAALTTDPAVRQALFDHAKRLERAEKVAIGEAKEGLPKEKPAKVEKIPAGEATEVPTEEVVAPNPDLVFETGKGWVKRSIPTGEATELAPETVVYDARGRALEVGRTYKDSKGRRAVWQADGTWKILR